ncbi:MAG: polysaccharide biosynthesis tyrosine autokinase [Spirochaetia bacterium]|nr:polysaccharide biosynthesis tyrosine autokinase [Spirochaetia bacterium]
MEQQLHQDDQNEISLKEILRIIKNRKWWLILTFFVVVSVVSVYIYKSVPIYQSSATLWIEPSQSGSSFEDLFAIQAGGSSTKIATEVEIIKSRRNIERLIEELDLVRLYSSRYEYKEPLTPQKLVSALTNTISVSTVKDTNIVRISVEHGDPLLARDIANSLASVYNELLKDLAQNDFSIRREFIESQIGPASANVTMAENRLREFKEANDVFLLDEEARVLLQQITQYEKQIDPYLIQRDEARNKQQVFQDSIREEGGDPVTSDEIASRELSAKVSEYTNAKIELAGYGSAGTQDANASRRDELQKRVLRLENEIRLMVSDRVYPADQSVSPYMQAYYTQLVNAYTQEIFANANIAYLTQMKQSYVDSMSNLPALEQKLLDLNRDVAVKENLYLLLLQNYEEAKIAEAAVSGTSTIIDKAIVNPNPIKPDKKMILAVGVLLGLFLGVLLIFLIEAFDDSVKDEDSVKRALGLDAPVLGRIPHLQFDEQADLDELVVYNDPTSPAAESYKLVAANVLYSSINPPKVITVCSSEMAAGKTTITANTAIAMAQNGLRTLIIDVDMRKPRIEKAFGLKRNSEGLVNYLLMGKELKSLILSPLERLPNLHLLPVGQLPPNPTALIASEKFQHMINELKNWYDRIIIDMPPLLASSDGLIVTRNTDGMIIVVRMGNSSKHGLQLSGENVLNADVKVLGTVINDITKENSYNYYHYYYYYNMGGEKVFKKKKFKNRYNSYSYSSREKPSTGKNPEMQDHTAAVRSSKKSVRKKRTSAKTTDSQAVNVKSVDPRTFNAEEKKVRTNPDSVLTKKKTKDYLADVEQDVIASMESADDTSGTDKS